MAAQLPDEEKIKAADYVIDNSGSLEQTREQVRVVRKKCALRRRNRSCSAKRMRELRFRLSDRA